MGFLLHGGVIEGRLFFFLVFVFSFVCLFFHHSKTLPKAFQFPIVLSPTLLSALCFPA